MRIWQTMLRSALGVFLLALTAGCAVAPATPDYAEVAPATTAGCVTTGSRIVSKVDDCRLIGRSVSAAQIHGAGVHTAAGALAMLYPSIVVYAP
jgi:hypothetical protein